MTVAAAASASGGNMLGDFGARDPFPEELASQFGARVQGNADTEHRIALPARTAELMGLSVGNCAPLEAGTPALSEQEAKALLRKVPIKPILSSWWQPSSRPLARRRGGRRGDYCTPGTERHAISAGALQVVGWKLVEGEDGMLRLRGEWKVKNFACGLELLKRVAAVAEDQGHHPDIHLHSFNQARVDIWSHSVGGLSLNDFILAAKIDLINTSDLLSKKPRAWA
eukprot:SM006556S20278  [mRNA]  locus=s6556:14:821:- [translate_table: standard]